MKKNVRNLIVLFCVIVFCFILTLGLYFTGRNAVTDTPVTKKDFSGVSVNAVSVTEVEGVMKMTAINYLPNDFAELNETVSGEDSGDAPAKRGTYRFCIDTLKDEEWNDTERLQKLLKPDGNYHLTMYIPPVFSACCVYLRYQNKEYVGSIDRYNVAYYGSFSAPSEFDDSVSHKTATQPVFIDIPISADHKYSKECIVTIHYEADNDNFVGISDGILIGEDSAVRKTVEGNRSLLLIGAIVGAATFLLFLFICVLKHSLAFVPQLIFAAGIFSALFAAYSLFGLTSVPYLVLGVRGFSVGLVLLASTMYLPKRAGRIPVLYPVFTLAAIASGIAFVLPFIATVSAYNALSAVYTALSVVCILTVFAFTLRDVIGGKTPWLRLNGVIAGFLAVTAAFADGTFPFISVTPAFWLCLLMLGITVVLGFSEFTSAEIHNRYLTANLEKEVAKQTQNLQTVISERDKILLYVSHDMKKTVVGMNGSLSDLRHYLSEPELVAKVDSLLQKSAELKKDFADLGKYGRQNYVAEQSEVLNLSRIVYNVTNELRPDCEANGIVLAVTLPEELNVYAKRAALESVILNLVLNAIEHSSCTRLEVATAKRKEMCRLTIVDDGKGIATDKNIFEPFVSGDSSENNSGLGLFLAKSAVESMHGELTYERKDNLTIFAATLPLA